VFFLYAFFMKLWSAAQSEQAYIVRKMRIKLNGSASWISHTVLGFATFERQLEHSALQHLAWAAANFQDSAIQGGAELIDAPAA
jgi:hypothetical protein